MSVCSCTSMPRSLKIWFTATMSSCTSTTLMHGLAPPHTAGRSGQHVWLRCERSQIRISLQAVVFIPQQLLRYSLGHGLHILTAVPRSTQPSTHHEMAKWVLAFGLSNNKMAMVDVDGSSLLVGSQPKLFSLVRGLVDTWRWVCIHQMNWVNSRNGSKLLRQHHKYHPGYYYYYCYHSLNTTAS